jgi:hypothetical protein
MQASIRGTLRCRTVLYNCLCNPLCLQVWKEIVEGLAVAKGAPTFKGQPLVTSRGPLTVAADMPDGAGIH